MRYRNQQRSSIAETFASMQLDNHESVLYFFQIDIMVYKLSRDKCFKELKGK